MAVGGHVVPIFGVTRILGVHTPLEILKNCKKRLARCKTRISNHPATFADETPRPRGSDNFTAIVAHYR